MSDHAFKLGDKVTILRRGWPGIYRVIKINKKSIKIAPVPGTGTKSDNKVNVSPGLITLADADLPLVPTPPASALGEDDAMTYATGALVPGVVVTSAQLSRKMQKPLTTKYVVLRSNTNNYSVAVLGGEPSGSRYYIDKDMVKPLKVKEKN